MFNKKDNFGIIQDHKTFEVFNESKRLLDRSQYLKMMEGERISALLPKSWKRSFFNGIVIPAKMRFCNECYGNIICKRCNFQVNENKEFEADLNLSKREASFEFGHMLPYFKELDDFFVLNYLNSCSILIWFTEIIVFIILMNSSLINDWYNE